MADSASLRLVISTSALELFAPVPSFPQPHTLKIALPVSIRLVTSAFRISLLLLYCESFGRGICGIMSREGTYPSLPKALLANKHKHVHVKELCFRFAFMVIYHQGTRLGKRRHLALPLPGKAGHCSTG